MADACLFPAAGYLMTALEAILILNDDLGSLEGIGITQLTFETGLLPSFPPKIVGTLRCSCLFVHMVSLTVCMSLPCTPIRKMIRFADTSWALSPPCTRAPQKTNFERSGQEELTNQRQRLLDDQVLATRVVDRQAFYARLAAIGLNYGPTFQGLKGRRVTPHTNTVFGVLAIPDINSVMAMQFECPHLIHPAALDSAFQMAFAAAIPEKPLNQAAVPVSMERIFVAAEMPRGAEITCVGTASARRIEKAIVARHAVCR